MSGENSTSEPIKFKSIKRRAIRKRKLSDEEEEDQNDAQKEGSESGDFNRDKLQETMELQKLRQRAGGISHVTLASGKKISKIEEIVAADADPFKLKTGGLLTLNAARTARAAEDPAAAAKDGTKELGLDDEVQNTRS